MRRKVKSKAVATGNKCVYRICRSGLLSAMLASCLLLVQSAWAGTPVLATISLEYTSGPVPDPVVVGANAKAQLLSRLYYSDGPPHEEILAGDLPHHGEKITYTTVWVKNNNTIVTQPTPPAAPNPDYPTITYTPDPPSGTPNEGCDVSNSEGCRNVELKASFSKPGTWVIKVKATLTSEFYEPASNVSNEVEVTFNVVEVVLTQVENTTIEAGNHYSENTTLLATVTPNPGGLKVRFIEQAGTTYYDGQNGATNLTDDAERVVTVAGAATSGSAQLTIKSLSDSNTTTAPQPAAIRVDLLNNDNNVLGASNTLNVVQWVDTGNNNFIDWLEQQTTDILACYKAKTGDVGTVANAVTGIIQHNSNTEAGATNPLGTVIGISPVHVPQTPPPGVTGNKHRRNINNELSGTVIHEARHAWQNKVRFDPNLGQDNDNDPETPSNDDDLDLRLEAVALTTDPLITEADGPSQSDNHNDNTETGFDLQEMDADNFGTAHRNDGCP